MLEQVASPQKLNHATPAARRKFRIRFGLGTLLLVAALIIHNGTPLLVLGLSGLALQVWGAVAWYHDSGASGEKTRN
jgi:hypothetical protein